ncbi:MAG: hypothetical protein ABIT16_00015 [Croceibacterium sp.]
MNRKFETAGILGASAVLALCGILGLIDTTMMIVLTVVLITGGRSCRRDRQPRQGG